MKTNRELIVYATKPRRH